MKNRKVYLGTVLLASGLVFGCGGDAAKLANTQAQNNNTGNVNGPAKPAESTMPVNTDQPANSAAPTNAMPAGKDPTQGKMPPGTGVEGPDDSVVNTELIDDVTETRTFKSHPQIQRIVRITYVNQDNKKSTKVYLKGGTVKELPESKVADPMKAPAADIMKAIGQ